MTPSSLKEFVIFITGRKLFNLLNEKNLIHFYIKTCSANTTAKLYKNGIRTKLNKTIFEYELEIFKNLINSNKLFIFK